MIKDNHRCEGHMPSKYWGEAINLCVEDDEGRYWAANDEYCSQVNYCPYCGQKAPTEVIKTTK